MSSNSMAAPRKSTLFFSARSAGYGTNRPWRSNSVLSPVVPACPSEPPSKTCTSFSSQIARARDKPGGSGPRFAPSGLQAHGERLELIQERRLDDRRHGRELHRRITLER